jgi:3-methyl-2-oxobutanoate hydroxymethyltransferase
MTQLAEAKIVRVQHLAAAKRASEKISMLTAYDQPTAAVFDAAGIDVLLVGDSMGNAVLGYETTLPVSLDDCVRATAAVRRGTRRAMIVADLPFGSYEASPERCFDSAVQLIKAGANAVKLEGGRPMTKQISVLSAAGIPVMAHLGFTPQSVNTLGGNRIQGRQPDSAEAIFQDATAVYQAGAFALVLELVPQDLARSVTTRLPIPTIGIGAGNGTDGQVLVWTDMAGLSKWAPSFVKRFGQLGAALEAATRDYAQAVRSGSYPGPEHSFD